MLFNDTQLSGKWGGGGGKGGVIILQGGVRIFQPPLQDTDPPVSNLGESLSRATPAAARVRAQRGERCALSECILFNTLMFVQIVNDQSVQMYFQ